MNRIRLPYNPNSVLSGVRMVDAAGIWDESYRSYQGRSDGPADVFSEVRSKACREKSAEAIAPITTTLRKG
ncbi:MAG: hypothetical protein ACNS62_10615 [Candidatus Cyclobacteriaceae bacterium M3_2C_046]